MTHSIYLVGATGKMGRTITEIVSQNPYWEIIAGLHSTLKTPSNSPFPLEPNFDSLKHADIIIDFSKLEAAEKVIKHALLEHKPLVIGTTGLSSKIQETLFTASEKIPIFYASNFSLGAHLCVKQAQSLARFCEGPGAIKIIETHHLQKKDAPSGTALTFQKALKEIYPFEIPIESIREGTIVGEHRICFKLEDETIELKHTALSRNAFAFGALRAAEFLIKKSRGFFGMEDLMQDLRNFSQGTAS